MSDKDKSGRKVPNSTNYFPKFRFPEFSEDWETLKLNEFATINPKSDELPREFIYIDLESVVNGILIKENKIRRIDAPSRAQRFLQNNDVLFQTVRPYQKNNYFFNRKGLYVASTGYAHLRTTQNSAFLFQFLHNQNFVDKVIEKCTGTSYPAINSTDLGKIKIHFPTIKEQNKIARFLGLFDARIQTQKKTIENLQSLKRSLLNKIFKRKNSFYKKTNWEEKQLAEISNEHQEKNLKNHYNEVFSVAKSKGVINQIEHLGRSFSASDVRNYKLIFPGDLVYTKSPTSDFPFGIIKQNRTNRIGVVSPLYCVFAPQNFALGYLLHEYFESSVNTFNYLNPLVQKGAKNTMNINNETFLNGAELFLPMDENEQNELYKLFLSINNKIKIEFQILEKLHQQKKFFLQNLFV